MRVMNSLSLGLDYFSAPTAHGPEMIVLPGEFPAHITRRKMD